ncbi:MAG: hypothetical protein ACI4QT_05285 [Kiritimatiellia bacterium]
MKKITVSALAIALLSMSTVSGRSDELPDLFSLHLDVERPSYIFSGAFQSDTQFGPYGSTDIAEAEAFFDFGKIDGILWGAFGLTGHAHGLYFVDNPSMNSLPDGLVDAYVEPSFTIRFVNGWSWRVAAQPGLYSDVTEPSFGCPVSVNAYFAASPDFSIVLGGTVRPGWDIPFIPTIGLRFSYEDMIRVELGCPRSRIDLFPGYVLSFFAQGEWTNITYGLEGKNGIPEDLTWDEIRVSAGASLRILGTWIVTGEIGTYLERELSADVAENNAMDLSKEPFIRVSLSSSF